MIRKGLWRLNYYVGFASEPFDMQANPQELLDLAGDPEYAAVMDDMEQALHRHVAPEIANAQAFQDQADMIERYGGREAAMKLGAPGATPPPAVPR